MMLQTQCLLSQIWLEVNPQASDAFDQLATDHGRRFAEIARDLLMADKMIENNERAIAALSATTGRPDVTARK